MLIHDEFYCEGDYNFAKFYGIAKKLNKRQCVEFSLYCVKDIFNFVEEEYKESVKHCIDLVEKWLIDENSVTNEALVRNSSVYYYAAYEAAWTAGWTLTNTDNVLNVSNNVNFDWTTAWTVIHTILAFNAVYAANNVSNEYLVIANSYLTKTTINCPNYEIEGKILYLIDELEENIIVHKDKYYVNMNGIENCPEYGFDTQEELLNELLNSKDRFWEFTRNWLDQLYKDDIVSEVA